MQMMSASRMSDSQEIILEQKNSSFRLPQARVNEPLGQATTATKRTFSGRASITGAFIKDGIPRNEPRIASHSQLVEKLPSEVSMDQCLVSNGDVEEDVDIQPGKRHRNSNWPLKSYSGNSDVSHQTISVLHDRRNAAMVQRPFPRPSKFIEGSMNDKISQIPDPSLIVDSEEIREKFDTEQNLLWKGSGKRQIGGSESQANRSVALLSLHNKVEASRPSSIVRFGKSLASAFNPSSWRIRSRTQEEETFNEALVRERKEKAEKAYKELKRSGKLSTAIVGSYARVHDGYPRNSKHDSGIQVDRRASIDNVEGIDCSKLLEVPLEEKRYGRVFLNSSSISNFDAAESLPSQIAGMSGESSLQAMKPSASEIYMNHGSAKQFRSVDDLSHNSQSQRHLSSHKDLLKQQKLVKRVSDLEGKLEAARRQLAEALGEPVPQQISNISRICFVPGGLSSLPSERLLSMHTAPDFEISHGGPCSDIGQAISTDERLGTQAIETSLSTAGIRQELNTLSKDVALEEPIKSGDCCDSQYPGLSMTEYSSKQIKSTLNPEKQSSRNRKSSDSHRPNDGISNKTLQKSDADITSESAKFSATQGKPVRPQKLRKVTQKPVSHVELYGKQREYASDENGTGDAQTGLNHMLQTSENRRTVLQKRTNPPANNHILVKGREPSPPPLVSFASVAELSERVSPGINPSQESIDQSTTQAIPSDDMSPVPRLPKGARRGHDKMMRDLTTHKCTSVTSHTTSRGRNIQHHKSADEPIKIEDKGRIDTKEPFEWPADVF